MDCFLREGSRRKRKSPPPPNSFETVLFWLCSFCFWTIVTRQAEVQLMKTVPGMGGGGIGRKWFHLRKEGTFQVNSIFQVWRRVGGNFLPPTGNSFYTNPLPWLANSLWKLSGCYSGCKKGVGSGTVRKALPEKQVCVHTHTAIWAWRLKSSKLPAHKLLKPKCWLVAFSGGEWKSKQVSFLRLSR